MFSIEFLCIPCNIAVEKERCWGRYTFLEELMRNIKVDSFGGLLHNKDMEDIIDELNHEKHHGSSLSFLEGMASKSTGES